MSQKNLISMDFDSIKNDLKDFLKKQDYFKDYNFEGSGLNILLDVLAYNSQNNAYLANVLANEAEIDSAILRSNVVSRAKLLGYTPKSKVASKATISIRVEDQTQQSESLLLPRGTRFSVKSDKQQFVFLTLNETNLIKVSQGVYEAKNIEIFEGKLKAYSFDVNHQDRRYVIPSKDIDTSTIRVAVYPNENSNEYEVYQKETSIQKIDQTSKAFWVYETDNGFYELKFGDGVFGKRPELNSVVYCEYLETSGEAANDLTGFTLVGSFRGYENADISIKTENRSYGGSQPESTTSIKLNAPRFFQSQNRAVTKDDYVALAHEVYPYAKSVAVWGGEEMNPPQFGKVLISIIQQSGNNLTETTKRTIERKLKERGVIGIQPKILDPNMIKINMAVKVTIRSGSNNSLGNLSGQIKNITLEHFREGFGAFDADFHYSNLLAEIQNHSRAIVGVRADYQLSITKEDPKNEEVFQFENSIVPGTLKSSSLKFRGDWKQLRDSNGDVLLDNLKIGNVDYSKGIIRLRDLDKLEVSGNALELLVTPENDDILTGPGSAIMLDESRLSVELRTAG